MLGLSRKDIRKILRYNARKGVFTWKSGQRAGKRAGSYRKPGTYRAIRIGDKNFPEHRLAYFLMTGKLPEVVDHKNNVRDDNRFSNLRAATLTQNNRNTSVYKNNKLGVKGVCFDKSKSRYIVTITIKGRRKYIGSFTSLREAIKARRKVAKAHFGKFYNG